MPIVYVLWTVAMLSVIASALTPTGRTAYSQAHNALEEAKATALVEAAVNYAALSLLEPRTNSRWRIDGVPNSFSFDGADMRVSIQDEAGRIDLNQTDKAVLSSLFRSVGLDEHLADELADRILDWRDRGQTRRLNGAQDTDYLAAGRSYGPRSGPFQRVTELRLVLGITPELFRRIEPAVTVYSNRPFVDPAVAPPEALRALPTWTAEAIETHMATRNGSASNVLSGTEVVEDGGSFNSALIGHAFTIRVDVLSPGKSDTREAVIRLTDDPLKPFWVLDWRYP